mgnify:CR=1 FL=1
MKTLKGLAVSSGISLGPAFVFHDDEESAIPRYSITEKETDGEWQRLQAAIEKTKNDISVLRDRTVQETGLENGAIFEAHLMMLDDPDVQESMEHALKTSLLNIEWIVHQHEQSLVKRLESLSDPLLKERSLDIHDITRRILDHLMFKERFSLADLSHDIILVSRNLLPSDMISMDRKHVLGIVMDAGGKTSHTAILARAFEIPAVLGLGGASKLVKYGDKLIVDGNSGEVIVEPDKPTMEYFEKLKAEVLKRDKFYSSVAELPAKTSDGKEILVKANIEVPEETDSVLRHGAAGVGLFRSEFLFMQPGLMPSEEAQFKAYKKVLAALPGKAVTIRTLDLGGDKLIKEIAQEGEKNPLLGWRAIRYCLSDRVLFKNQLRAILRASIYGEARLMFPMISGPEELDATLAILEEAKEECRKKGQAFKEDLPVGIMIEVPSAAMTADILAEKASFMSIGTNDLIQYTIAVDRGNEKVAYLYEPYHPAILRLIKKVVDDGHGAGIPVSMCGEMASDPMSAILLLGLGMDELSMSAVSVPSVKHALRSVNLKEAEEAAVMALKCKSHKMVEAILKSKFGDRLDSI